MNTDCPESDQRRPTIEAVASILAAYSMRSDAAQKILAYLLRCGEAFSTWLQRGRHCRALERFSDHRLKDIGLVRSDSGPDWWRFG